MREYDSQSIDGKCQWVDNIFFERRAGIHSTSDFWCCSSFLSLYRVTNNINLFKHLLYLVYSRNDAESGREGGGGGNNEPIGSLFAEKCTLTQPRHPLMHFTFQSDRQRGYWRETRSCTVWSNRSASARQARPFRETRTDRCPTGSSVQPANINGYVRGYGTACYMETHDTDWLGGAFRSKKEKNRIASKRSAVLFRVLLMV